MARAGDLGTRTRSMFAIIPADHLAALASRGRMRRFPRRTVLLRQGDFADAMYVIREGVVDVIQADALGRRTHLALLGEGEVVGELGVLSGEPRNATVIAVNDVTVMRIEREDVLRGLLDLPGLPQALRLHLSARLEGSAPGAIPGLAPVRRGQPAEALTVEERIARW